MRPVSPGFLPAVLAALFLLAAAPAAPAQEAPAQEGPARTAPADRPPADAAAGLSPEQARQLLDILQDEDRRAALVDSLRKTAATTAAPPEGKPAPPPATESELALDPDSPAARLAAEAQTWAGTIGARLTETVGVIAAVFEHWRTTAAALVNSPLRATWGETLLRAAVVFGIALLAERLTLRALRDVTAAMVPRTGVAATTGPAPVDAPAAPAEASAPAPERQGLRARRLLHRLPFLLGRFLLDLLPVVIFAIAAGMALSLPLAAAASTRAVVGLLEAYVLGRVALCLVRLVVAPADRRLRLLRITDGSAAATQRWARRITVTALGGGAMAQAALLLGLPPSMHDALVRLVALAVHILLALAVIRARRPVAAWIRGPEGRQGVIAILRGRLARVWHVFAALYILALWLVWALGVQGGFARLQEVFFVTGAILILARLTSILLLGGLEHLLLPDSTFSRRFAAVAERMRSYQGALRALLSGAIALVTGVALLQSWGLDVLDWFSFGSLGRELVAAFANIALVVVVAVGVWEGVNATIDRQLSRLTLTAHFVQAARLRTLRPILRTGLMVVLVSLVGLTVLSEIGVNIAPLLAGAGIIGVAFGFGSQKLVQDLITGLFLLLENAMQVGDWVTVSGLSGKVEQLSIRTIHLRAGDGSLHIIPFSSVTSVTNTNRGLGNAAVSVSVSSTEDIDRVAGVLKEIAAGLRNDPDFGPAILDEFQLWGVDKVDGPVVTVVGQIPCTDTGRWGVQREFNRRLQQRFAALGIELASPTQTLSLWTPRREVPGGPAEAAQAPCAPAPPRRNAAAT